MHTILGTKQKQSSAFLEDGTRVPVTFVAVSDNPVVSIKTQEKHGYVAVQLGQGRTKRPTKQTAGHAKKGANLDYAPYFLVEARFPKDTNPEEMPKPGDMVSASSVLEAGDIIDVTGKSKGKGFAGGVKRHHFKGGPRTHGQSDRERAPGSVGQTTTPGRVYRGKRMAGKMGNDKVTLKNLEVLDVDGTTVVIKGLVPGIIGSYLVIKKVSKNKKFVPLFKEQTTQTAEVVQEEKKEAVSEEVSTAPTVEPQTPVEEVKEEIAAEAPKEAAEEKKEEVQTEQK